MSIPRKYSRANVLLLLFFLFSPFLLEAMHINKTGAPLESLWHYISWHFLGILAGALAFPSILRGLRTLKMGRRGKALLILVKIVLCGSAALILYKLPVLSASQQLPAFSYMAFLRGALFPLALLLFFHIFPSGRHGKILGLIFAGVEVLWFISSSYIDISSSMAVSPDGPATAGPLMHPIRSFLHIGSLWTASTALIIWATAPDILDAERQGRSADEESPVIPEYRAGFRPGVVLAIALCCYVLRAFLNNSLGYGIHTFCLSIFSHAGLGCLLLGAGIVIDKAGAKGMRVIVTACCLSFLMFPIMPEVPADGVFFALIYSADFLVWPVFLLSMTLLTGRGPYEGKLPGLMCVMPCLLLLVSYYALCNPPQQSDLSLFWSTVISAVIVGLLFQIVRGRGEQDKAVHAKPPEQLPAPLEQVSFEEFVYRHNISQRKRELLKLLLQGNSTKKMAEAMGITQYTVRLHIHEILRATGLKNRKALMDAIRF